MHTWSLAIPPYSWAHKACGSVGSCKGMSYREWCERPSSSIFHGGVLRAKIDTSGWSYNSQRISLRTVAPVSSITPEISQHVIHTLWNLQFTYNYAGHQQLNCEVASYACFDHVHETRVGFSMPWSLSFNPEGHVNVQQYASLIITGQLNMTNTVLGCIQTYTPDNFITDLIF
jgi:hypothetical protein